VAGVASVWLYARQSVWPWPTGIANSGFWLVLFAGERLYLDAGLQIVYIGLGLGLGVGAIGSGTSATSVARRPRWPRWPPPVPTACTC